MADPKTIALEFNNCINSRDINGLASRMTDDHSFIDKEGNRFTGKDTCTKVWTMFFSSFPDHRNTFELVNTNENIVTIIGYSSCTDKRLEGRAIWTARIADDKVSEWRVYDDNPQTRISLAIQ